MERKQDQFWRHLQPEHLRARAFCRKLAGNRDDGDDLYQEALVAAYVRLSDLKDPHSFRPWLYRILVNTFRNRVRKTRNRAETGLTEAVAASAAGENPSPQYAARRRLETALRALAPREQALVVLFELHGWPLADLATVFGASVGSLKVRLHRARRKMRRALEKAPVSDAEPARNETKGEICVATKPGKS